ncbi:endonuclease domain-containing protein [Streptomyces pimonensis]|uniref:endonuclease domain-containing protein n=1 Tax=Streptomyces pimonensis TaxID=2860288 RepID=UPI003528A83C
MLRRVLPAASGGRGRKVREKASVPPGRKCCPRCGGVKARSEWERDKSSSDVWASHRRAERNRVGCFTCEYGLTPADLDAPAAERRGICCVCPAAPAEHVDHRHGTGRVRGVLCFSRNAALGQF